eukprot:TRINITY_DN374_c0_g2_i1.p1 TRINITY_DN374_c0_g2~~TRINITY_DN374_c0_g2_i1.p1  ORF type:complete len:421 (-),score=179.65 TRINITY_DN374_c0_g2_i1:69-1331(-)
MDEEKGTSKIENKEEKKIEKEEEGSKKNNEKEVDVVEDEEEDEDDEEEDDVEVESEEYYSFDEDEEEEEMDEEEYINELISEIATNLQSVKNKMGDINTHLQFINQLRTDRQKLRSKIKELAEELRKFRDIQQLQIVLDKKQTEELEVLQNEKEILLEENESLLKENNLLKIEHNDAIISLRREYKDDLEQISIDMQLLVVQNADMEKEIETLTEELEKLKKGGSDSSSSSNNNNDDDNSDEKEEGEKKEDEDDDEDKDKDKDNNDEKNNRKAIICRFADKWKKSKILKKHLSSNDDQFILKFDEHYKYYSKDGNKFEVWFVEDIENKVITMHRKDISPLDDQNNQNNNNNNGNNNNISHNHYSIWNIKMLSSSLLLIEGVVSEFGLIFISGSVIFLIEGDRPETLVTYALRPIENYNYH